MGDQSKKEKKVEELVGNSFVVVRVVVEDEVVFPVENQDVPIEDEGLLVECVVLSVRYVL